MTDYKVTCYTVGATLITQKKPTTCPIDGCENWTCDGLNLYTSKNACKACCSVHERFHISPTMCNVLVSDNTIMTYGTHFQKYPAGYNSMSNGTVTFKSDGDAIGYFMLNGTEKYNPVTTNGLTLRAKCSIDDLSKVDLSSSWILAWTSALGAVLIVGGTTVGTIKLQTYNDGGEDIETTDNIVCDLEDNNEFEIVFESATSMKFYLNRTLVATHTTYIPWSDTSTPAAGLGFSNGIVENGGGAVGQTWDEYDMISTEVS